VIAALALAAAAALPASDAWVVISSDELQARYRQLWAVSDIHGHREELEHLLLAAHLVRRDAIGELRWDAQLHSLPVAAFVGRWLFAHSGYIDGTPESLKAIALDWAADGPKRYAVLASGRSIVDYHRWWASPERRRAMRENLRLLGLDAVVFGHDPRALGVAGAIAIDDSGAFLKLDAGLKENRSAGMLLRCDIPRAVQRGLAACEAMLPDGALRQLPTVHLDP